MKRRLFPICSAASLLLCVATCVLWVRSDYRADTLAWSMGSPPEATAQLLRVYVLEVSGGGAKLTYRAYELTEQDQIDEHSGKSEFEHHREGDTRYPAIWQQDSDPPYPSIRRAGFGFVALRAQPHDGRVPPMDLYVVEAVLPLWTLAAALGVCPALYALRRIRAGRRLTGEGGGCPCPACGYDTRATPGRCPECGAVSVEISGTWESAAIRLTCDCRASQGSGCRHSLARLRQINRAVRRR